MNETAPRIGSVDWLLGIRFFLLTFTIAGILGSAVTVSWWARLLLDNWRWLFANVRDTIHQVLQGVGIELNWQSQESLPLIIVMLSVVGLGYARLAASRTKFVAPHPFAAFAASLIGLFLITASEFLVPPSSNVPAEVIEIRQRCTFIEQANPFDEVKCDLPDALTPTKHAADHSLMALGFLLYGLAVASFSYELIAASIAACLFLGLGMIDIRPMVGPTSQSTQSNPISAASQSPRDCRGEGQASFPSIARDTNPQRSCLTTAESPCV